VGVDAAPNTGEALVACPAGSPHNHCGCQRGLNLRRRGKLGSST
jgi:hypothetical protein